jgi:plasmid maintenance system antidote protein VapI
MPVNRLIPDALSGRNARNAMSGVVNERRGISPEMAIRLAKAFGSAPEVWAGLQLDYDMAQAMKRANEIKVRRVPRPALGAE